MSARDDVLAAVRAALAPTRDHDAGRGVGRGVAAPSAETPAHAPMRSADRAVMLDLFAERVADYRAKVTRCTAADLVATMAAALGGATAVVVPSGLDLAVPGRVVDDGLSHSDLDAVDAVVTAAAVGIAETGTVVLDHGPDQGRRALTLRSRPARLCRARATRSCPTCPTPSPGSTRRARQTWISGPSATSDIELSRVEGVHGPRRLHVVLVAGEAGEVGP